jgi:UDP-N-acetylmuramoyl-tripeptide--D-alanyl-D-alanine ligase
VDLSLDEIALITGGRVHRAPERPERVVARALSFDSRTLEAGRGFVAIRDARDGHEFVSDAFARGATLAIVERVPAGVEGPLVVVEDTMLALRVLAATARDRLATAHVVGITGSVGKTATKDLTAAALSRATRVHASTASFNNELGLPVTLLAAPDRTEALVLEMGARFAGNIRELCAIARPTIGVITNLGLAHAEHLGGPAGVAAVKGELLDALPAGGLAILNADDETVRALRARTEARVVTAGAAGDADVRTSSVRIDAELRATFRLDSPWGSAPEVRLAVRGAYQVANAALAATVGLTQGVPIEAVVDALARAGTAEWRMELTTSPGGLVVLNDAYNANPTSMAAALESLAALDVPGRRIAVLGEMRELGEVSAAEHARMGELVADAGVDAVVVVGPGTEELAAAAAARGVEVHTAADHAAATAVVRALARPGDAVLVKASRAVGLERVAAALHEPGVTSADGVGDHA